VELGKGNHGGLEGAVVVGMLVRSSDDPHRSSREIESSAGLGKPYRDRERLVRSSPIFLGALPALNCREGVDRALILLLVAESELVAPVDHREISREAGCDDADEHRGQGVMDWGLEEFRVPTVQVMRRISR